MVFMKARRSQLLLAGSLAAAVTVFTVTACAGSAAAPAQVIRPWPASMLPTGGILNGTIQPL